MAVACLAYPLGGAWLALGLAFYAATLSLRPGLSLPVVLAVLPLADFAPWSGWILVNEFDLVLAITVAMWLLRSRDGGASPPLPRSAKWAVALVAVSYFVSALIGFLPVSPFDANALFGPYTPWNSVRQLKGFLWGLALLPLLVEAARERDRFQRGFTLGMVLGLAGTLFVILWQREVFAGLLDFARVYRVEGPFPELHTGGGDVHAYLVAAIPFTVAWAYERPSRARVGLAVVLFVLSTYAVGVTFTRGAYVGYVAALIAIGVALARYRLPSQDLRIERPVALAGLVLIGLVVLAPIASGGFMLARLSGTQAEAMTRSHHWAQAIGMMDKDLRTTLFGMGLGTFPKTLLVKQPEAASATFSFRREADDNYLKLGSGRPLYLDQRLEIVPGQTYTIALEMRGTRSNARLDAMLCEKSIQYSFRCASATFGPGSSRTWERHEAKLNANGIDAGSWLVRRPVALSLVNLGAGSVIDVHRVQLLDAAGRDLVVNGDFSAGGARWFFAADDHLPWHVFNLWVAILFEQGWLGVVALAGVVALTLRNSALAMWRGELHSGMLLAATVGFLAVGITESLFDGPRVATLCFVLLFASLARSPGGQAVAGTGQP